MRSVQTYEQLNKVISTSGTGIYRWREKLAGGKPHLRVTCSNENNENKCRNLGWKLSFLWRFHLFEFKNHLSFLLYKQRREQLKVVTFHRLNIMKVRRVNRIPERNARCFTLSDRSPWYVFEERLFIFIIFEMATSIKGAMLFTFVSGGINGFSVF